MNRLRVFAAGFSAFALANSLMITTASATTAGTAQTQAAPYRIVVKVQAPHTIKDVIDLYPVTLDGAILASRGIYTVTPADNQTAHDQSATEALAQRIDHQKWVLYAETDDTVELNDTQFHGWPEGSPTDLTTTSQDYSDQALVSTLDLDAVHRSTVGTGETIAILDTGADPNAPVLARRLGPGWNYVNDNSNTNDVASHVDTSGNGIFDEAYGHGTFVSGLAALVAPGATILPYRVLDSDGNGSLYEVSEAIIDAVNNGANVINLSVSLRSGTNSDVLADAIDFARRSHVVVVGAAGNDGNSTIHFPAAQSGVISTSALAANGTQLASFSDWGSWAEVAAPGQDVIGPLPGGRYAHWAGTSMAAPIVSGQAALLLASQSRADSDDVDDAITKSAVKLRGPKLHDGAVNIVASLSYLARHH